MTEHFFETTAGIKIKIPPISMLDLQLAQNAAEKKFRARGEPVDPPTYEVEVLGGEKEYHPHTETTILDASEEDKATWVKYLETSGWVQEETQDRTALVFLEGILVELPEDNAWAERRKKLFGEEVPEDLDQRKLYYLNNVLLKTPADKSGLMLEIQRLSMTGTNEEAIEAMEELFRRQMEIQGRAGVEALKALAKEETGVVLQPPPTGRAGGQSAGPNGAPTERVAGRRPGRDRRR